MSKKTRLAVGALGALCAVFMLMEMFAWSFVASRLAELSPQVIEETKAIGANQGLYNGFLAAGLFWALYAPPALGKQVALFFTACVLMAGLFGAITINLRLFIAQSVPALIVLFFLWKERRTSLQ